MHDALIIHCQREEAEMNEQILLPVTVVSVETLGGLEGETLERKLQKFFIKQFPGIMTNQRLGGGTFVRGGPGGRQLLNLRGLRGPAPTKRSNKPCCTTLCSSPRLTVKRRTNSQIWAIPERNYCLLGASLRKKLLLFQGQISGG